MDSLYNIFQLNARNFSPSMAIGIEDEVLGPLVYEIESSMQEKAARLCQKLKDFEDRDDESLIPQGEAGDCRRVQLRFEKLKKFLDEAEQRGLEGAKDVDKYSRDREIAELLAMEAQCQQVQGLQETFASFRKTAQEVESIARAQHQGEPQLQEEIVETIKRLEEKVEGLEQQINTEKN